MPADQIDNTDTEANPRTIQKLRDSNRRLRSQCRQLENKNLALEKQYKSLEKQYKSLKSSSAYQVGYAIVSAFSKPGMNTIKLPIRLGRCVTRAVVKRGKRLYLRGKTWLNNHVTLVQRDKKPSFVYREFDRKQLPDSYTGSG